METEEKKVFVKEFLSQEEEDGEMQGQQEKDEEQSMHGLWGYLCY